MFIPFKKLRTMLLACCIHSFCVATPVVEVRFIGSCGDVENDRFCGALLVNELQQRMGDTCLVSFEIGDAAHFGDRFTIHLSGDPDTAEALGTRLFDELESIQQGGDDFCGWLAALRSETIPSVEYFVIDRDFWEDLQGAKPFTGDEAEILSYLEQLGYKEADFEPYDELYIRVLTSEEKEAISYILLSLADDSLLTLAMKRTELDRQGAKIEHVHPLVFLGYIASTPHLQEKFHKVAERRFTWKPWVDGFSSKMRFYVARGEIFPYFPGFCLRTGANPMAVIALIKREDYEGLLRHFF